MKLLVLAQTPPPLHGQSAMVQAMIEGLGGRPGLTLHHVNLRLSRTYADIGRVRIGKIFRSAALACRAIRVRLRNRCDTLYYVPAPPGKRGALYRDWLVMLLCRPFFRRLVLHWHAAGLGEWVTSSACGWERSVTQRLLGRADLAIVLADALRPDAEILHARRTVVVPNGIPDPGPSRTKHGGGFARWQALFLGLCSEEKGLFAAADAVLEANGRGGTTCFTLVAAGPFPDEGTAARFRALSEAHPGVLTHRGFVSGPEKAALFAASQCLLFPTRYSAEGLPLVVLEAFAHDVPVIATRWRALPETVPSNCGMLVTPGDRSALADALLQIRRSPPEPGTCRDHYLKNYQLPQHLDRLAGVLRELEAPFSATAPAETRA